MHDNKQICGEMFIQFTHSPFVILYTIIFHTRKESLHWNGERETSCVHSLYYILVPCYYIYPGGLVLYPGTILYIMVARTACH